MSGPLDGIQVIDCGHWIQGPGTGAILGDLGADVIKVEPPVTGDPMRGILTTTDAQTAVLERNYAFEVYNRNKRGITLDLRKQKGKEIIFKLIEKADVFLHNWRADVAQRLGLDYETLSPLNPRLIYAESSGWGPEGPDAKKPAYDFAAVARSGMMYLAGEAGMPPLMLATGFGDQTAAAVGVLGILAALVARDRLQVGQKVDASLLGSTLFLETVPLSHYLINNVEYPRRVRSKMGNPLWNFYCCADDKWIMLAMMQPDRHWSAFCKVLNIQELEKDPKFATLKARGENREELISILDRIFLARPRDEWVKLLQEEGVICGLLQTTAEVASDPQVIANEYIIEVNHPVWGPIKEVGFPYKFSKTTASVRRTAPEMGQHTEEILLEIGYTWDDITQLKNEAII